MGFEIWDSNPRVPRQCITFGQPLPSGVQTSDRNRSVDPSVPTKAVRATTANQTTSTSLLCWKLFPDQPPLSFRNNCVAKRPDLNPNPANINKFRRQRPTRKPSGISIANKIIMEIVGTVSPHSCVIIHRDSLISTRPRYVIASL